MHIPVRIASMNDSDIVTSLLCASYRTMMRGAYDDSVLDAALPAMTVAQPGLLQSGSYYIAEMTAGDIVGCGGWTRERPGNGEVSIGIGHIRHFAVHPEWARRGVGRALFARCKDDAKAVGVTEFECYSSINGEPFYAAMGFVRDRVVDVEMLHGIKFPSVRMIANILPD